MRVTTFHMENIRGIGRLDPGEDDFTLLIGENNTSKTRVLDDPWARSPGRRSAPG